MKDSEVAVLLFVVICIFGVCFAFGYTIGEEDGMINVASGQRSCELVVEVDQTSDWNCDE